MKIISILFLLSFTLMSCTNNEIVENNKKVEPKVVQETTENNLNNNNEKMAEKTTVSVGDNIAVTYTGKLDDGSVFDATVNHGGEPLKFKVGEGNMIKGFDNGVVGMKLGESKTIEIEPIDAYGEYNPELKQVLQKKDLVSFTNAGIKLEVGVSLPTQYGNFEIIEADEETVTIDANHNLAGKKLIFEVEVVEIK